MKNWTIGGLLAIITVVAVACGAEPGDAPAASPDSQVSQDPGQADAGAASDAPATPAAAAGIDETCVQRVLGRSASGFGDITAAERDAVFQQCSGGEQDQLTRQFATGGGDLLASLDAACVSGITGSSELDLGQLTVEQRRQLVTECAPDGFQGGQAGPGGRFGGLGDLLQGCVTEALGETPANLFGLTEEQSAAVAEACGDQLPDGIAGGFGGGGDFFGGGQDGAGGGGFFGGGQDGEGGGGFFGGGPGGAGGGGFFGGIDFASDCVTDAVGRAVSGPGDLTQAEFQQIFANCR